MGKKMKLPWSKNLDTKPSSSSPPWPWPTCGNIRTLSFRASNVRYQDSFHIFNSTSSTSSETHSTVSDELDDDVVKNAMSSLRSDRLFFEPERSSSLVSTPMNVEKDQKSNYYEENEGVYRECEIFSMDSDKPFEDFRRSMEEMVEAHGLKEWHELEGLLECYLKINGKTNHGYILGAFVDLLASLSLKITNLTNSSITNLTTCSSSSLLSTHSICSFPSSPLSLPSSSRTTPSILGNDNDMDHDDAHSSHCHVIS